MRKKTIGTSKCSKCGAKNFFSFYSLNIADDYSDKEPRFFYNCRKCGMRHNLSLRQLPKGMTST